MKEILNSDLLDELQKKLNISFKDKKLLQKALIHKSFSNEKAEDIKDNERLEFLGDSVLDLAISSFIFEKFPDYPEGELARMRSILVSERMLARKANQLQLGLFLFLGHGEERSGGRKRKSILADSLEALFGAIFIDRGYAFVRDFILKHFTSEIISVDRGKFIHDYKTTLQEYIQKNNPGRPEYKVIAAEGPDHQKTFRVKVIFQNRCLGQGEASTKKEAQQEAAREALINLNQS